MTTHIVLNCLNHDHDSCMDTDCELSFFFSFTMKLMLSW